MYNIHDTSCKIYKINCMEALTNAIDAAKSARSALLQKHRENEIRFCKLNETVISAMKELEISSFKMDVPTIGVVNVTPSGIEVSFCPIHFNENREKVLIDAFVAYFQALANRYYNRIP